MSVLILAFDTSSTSGSIALLEKNTLISELTVGDVGTHAGWLMEAIEGQLRGSGFSILEVDLFALDIGPGSFTGLRIGVSTVKGLAWPLNKKVVGVSTLKALACNLRYSGLPVCPLLDARKGEVYTAMYRFNNDRVETLLVDSAMAPQKLFETIEKSGVPGPVVFLGGGLKVYSEIIKENVKDAILAPEPLWHLRASNIGLLAYDEGLQGAEASHIRPVYLRKSEAEIKAGHRDTKGRRNGAETP